MLAAVVHATSLPGVSIHLLYAAAVLLTGMAFLRSRRQHGRAFLAHRQELALRKELLSYLLFTGSPQPMAASALGREISRLIAQRSSFPRAALMLRDQTGTLRVTGSAGLDDLSVDALNRWGDRVSAPGMSLAHLFAGQERVATSSFLLQMERRCARERNPLSTLLCKKAFVVPLRRNDGLLGALVVCAEVRGASPRRAASVRGKRDAAVPAHLPLPELLQPLEAFAERLAMQLSAAESVSPTWAQQLPQRSERRERHRSRLREQQRQPGKGEVREPSAVRTLSPPAPQAPSQALSQPAPGSSGIASLLDRLRQVVAPSRLVAGRRFGGSGRSPSQR